MQDAYLGIDLGTSFIKASAVNESGEVTLSFRTKAPAVTSPRPGWTEVNPFDYYFNFRRFIKKVIKALGSGRVNVGLSAMAPVMIPVDKSCYPIYNGILYNDTRSASEIEELNRDYGDLLFNENGNVVNNQQWVPKIVWFRKNFPELYERTWKFMELTTFIICKMSGVVATDVTMAQEEGFLNYRDRKLSYKILNELKIDPEKIPEPSEVAEQRVEFNIDGVSFKTTAGTVDFIGSSVSLDLLNEGKLALILGSTGVISYSTVAPKPDKRLYLDVGPYPGLFYVNGATAASGIFLDYVMGILGMKNKYKRLDRLLNNQNVNTEGLVALPYLIGERTPILDPRARAVFFGITNRTGKTELLKATIEAIAFSMKHHYSIMLELGYRPGRVLLSGGLSNLDVMRKAIADSLGMNIMKVNDGSETVGDAIISLVAAGVISWNDASKLIEDRLLRGMIINAEPQPWIEKNFMIYTQLYERLKDLFPL